MMNGNCRGSITISMLIVLMITGILSFSFINVVSYESASYQNIYDELYILSRAETALSKGAALVKSQMFESSFDQDMYQEILKPLHDEDPYQVELSLTGEQKDSAFARVFRKDDIELADTLLILKSLIRPKFANEYFMLFDKPGTPYFLSGDTIDGKIHSNSYIKTAGTPYFTDVIECGVQSEYGFKQYMFYKGNPQFNKPIQWESDIFDLSNQADNIRNGADKFFSNPGSVAEVEFKENSFNIRYRGTKDEGRYTSPISYPIDRFSSLYFSQDVEVRGIVAGNITIGSRGNILITDDVVYKGSNPITGEPTDSPYMLGLIAEKNVLINKPIQKVQRDGGIRVNAAIVAMDSSMSTKNLLNPNMGTFHLWGSITEMTRGTNAVSRDEQIVFGYQKNWHYDRRLAMKTPPRFTPIKTADGVIKYTVTGWNRKY